MIDISGPFFLNSEYTLVQLTLHLVPERNGPLAAEKACVLLLQLQIGADSISWYQKVAM